MAYKTWEDVYRRKETEELYKIYKGYDHPTFEQKELALLVLKERNFDFGKARHYIEQWENEKREKSTRFAKKHPITYFLMKNWGYLISLIALSLLTYLFVNFRDYNFNKTDDEVRFFIHILSIGLVITTFVGLSIQYLMRKKKSYHYTNQ